MRADCAHAQGKDPRRIGRCVKCDALMLTPDVTPMFRRDPDLEERLTLIAARAAGVSESVARSLTIFSNGRIAPGGVRDIPMDPEAREEISDCRNYLVWGIQPIYRRMQAGDPQAGHDYSRRMRALSRQVLAWQDLL